MEILNAEVHNDRLPPSLNGTLVPNHPEVLEFGPGGILHHK